METKRLPGVAASVVVTGMLLGATAAGLVMPIDMGHAAGRAAWRTGPARSGCLRSPVRDLRPYLCARCSALLYGRFSLGSWGILLAWSCLMAAANTALPAARHLLRAPTGSLLSARPRLHMFRRSSKRRAGARFSCSASAGLRLLAFKLIIAATRIRLLPYLAATAVGVVPNVILYAGSGAFDQRQSKVISSFV